MVSGKKAWLMPGKLTMVILVLGFLFILIYIIYKRVIHPILG